MPITQLLKSGESETLEFKKSTGEWKEIVATISAFANTKGGIILVGIDKKGNLSDVNIGKGTVEDLTNKIITNTEPRVYPEINVRSVKGKKVILIKIEMYPYDVVLAFGKPYKRVGKSTVKMSKDEYEKRGLRSLCAKLAEEVKKHHQKLIDAGIMVFGIIGIAGSPSCGVNKTNRSKNGGYVEVKGKGIFIEELQKRMETIYLEWDYRNPEDSLRKVEKEILKKIRESSLIIDSH